ncbi:MAG: hypothetical protein JO134_10335 [Xanthobacteraceae bacterium]|nr:hypothetical protein [Xanthobacteraceae bacterium]
MKLEILFDQKLTGQAIASRYRRDLEEANLGSGQHGFEFVPEKDLYLNAEIIEVKMPNGAIIGTHRTRPSAGAG